MNTINTNGYGFFDRTPKHRQQKRKYIRWPLSKVKLLCFEGHYQKVKRPLANHIFHKGLVFRIKNTTEETK